VTAWFKHPLRVTGRLLWLAAEMSFAALGYMVSCAFCRKDTPAIKRAKWLQRASRHTLRVFRIEAQPLGPVPSGGLLVSNHLSYLDILVLAALTPCVFVAKSEVKGWPLFGWFAKRAGTIFVHRDRRALAGQAVNEIENALRSGAVVVLFPEGTSSGGQTVLPFKSSLLEPVARPEHSLTVACLRYDLSDGDVSEEVCYWKDMTLVPHLINLCGKLSVQASARFQTVCGERGNRKQLALELHDRILQMKRDDTTVSGEHTARVQSSSEGNRRQPSPHFQSEKHEDNSAAQPLEALKFQRTV
jgi:1-acyl-sn-glycerol-3-phosphate acyltransferase